jgi:hypothetical protein
MSVRTGRFLLRFIFPVLLAACDDWALLINSEGTLSITIVSDGDRGDRFRVRALQSNGISSTLDVPPSGTLELGRFRPGRLELTLLAPAGCRVTSPNPLMLTIGDEPASLEFDVNCR